MCKVMWGVYVDCSSNAVDMYGHYGRHICSGAYANNVKCMNTSVPGHSVDSSEFI